jgi:hypothetical protein
LRSIYPPYLTLNDAGNDHYLDISFNVRNGIVKTWPFLKPFGIVPLNIRSCHPQHTLFNVAVNELTRLLRLLSKDMETQPWVEFWFAKFRAAGYTDSALIRAKHIAMRNFFDTKGASKTTRTLAFTEGAIVHAECWRGARTYTNTLIERELNTKIVTAWKSGVKLQTLMTK